MSLGTQPMSAERLLAANLPRCELIGGGIVVMSPAGFDHGRSASKIVGALENHVAPRRLGVVTTAEAGFQIAHNPDTVRVPDVAFVRADRIPPGGVKGFFQGAPDLAVEVVSPTDRAGEVAAKVQIWLDAGSPMVWVVDPEKRTLAVHRSGNDVTVLSASDTLQGGDVLPEFSISVGLIFA
jgi:Uma2 family endonuclease